MAIEAKRGCGFRKVGALYLCGSGITVSCDRLPYLIEYCPVCGSGIKFTRGFSWVDWEKFAGIHEDCKCSNPLLCYMCVPSGYPQPYGLLWVGEAFYTPQSFIEEALGMGVSKRIPFVPKELKLGETVVMFAHKKAITRLPTPEEMNEQGHEASNAEEGQVFKVAVAPLELPGIFYVFKPTAIEMPVWESELTEEKLKELSSRSITPIPIPDGDLDHDPSENVTIALDPVTKKFCKVLLDESAGQED